MNTTLWNSFEDEFYIINSKWFDKWKSYVNFDYFMENNKKYLNLLSHISNNIVQPEETKREVFKDIKLTEQTQTQTQKIEALIHSEADKFIIDTFLKNNAEKYPGSVLNKDLLIDKSLHYFDYNNKNSHLNYNIIDQYQVGSEFFMVNKRIWNYFKTVYGGKELKRYLVSISPNNETLLELKLKNVMIVDLILNLRLKYAFSE
jgi:hypothetical protein